MHYLTFLKDILNILGVLTLFLIGSVLDLSIEKVTFLQAADFF